MTRTQTPPKEKTEKKGLKAEQKTWLVQFIGADVPWEVKVKTGEKDSKGKPVEKDATVLFAEMEQLEQEIAEKKKKGENVDPADEKKLADNQELLAKVGLPSVLEKSDKFADKRKKKDDALAEVRNMIDLQKEDIRSETDVEYKVSNRLLGSKTVKAKIKKGESKNGTKAKEDGQAELEYDEEYYKGEGRTITGPSPQQEKALKLVIAQLEELTNKLKTLKDGDDAPLFSPNELMEEIWTPLVREQLVSEAQCPNEFSRILTLWNGANKLYQERCKALAKEEEDRFAGAKEFLDDADDLIGIGTGVVDVVLSIVGTGAKSKDILKLASKCARAGVQLTGKALEKDYLGAAGKVGDVLAAAVPEPWNKVAKGSYMACVNLAGMAKKLADKDSDSAFDMFMDAVGNTLSSIGAGTDEDLFDRIGKHATGGLKVLYKSRKIAVLIADPNADPKKVWEELGKIAALATQSAIAEVLNKEADEEKEKLKDQYGGDEENEKYKEALKKLQKQQEGLADAWDKQAGVLGEESEGSENPGLVGKLADVMQRRGVLPPDPEAVEKKAIEKGAQAMNEEMDNANALFGRQMASAFGVSVGAQGEEDMADLAEIYDIDTIIAQVEADQAQIALLNAVLDAIGGVLALLVPQLGGVVKAKQFAMNVVAAVRRSQELLKFTALLSDARKATSPQAYVLIAQVDELKHQLKNDTISAALHLSQAIAVSTAAACELSGMAAAGGQAMKAVNAGLETLEQAKDFTYKKFKQKKVKRAWANFKAALANPTVRRKVIKSFRKNPTLAKYAIAYGALEMGDAIAKEALRKCGLNDMVLAQEKTNADKVVRYLEVKFSDDIQVTGVVSKFAPDGGELSYDSWGKNKEAAKTADGTNQWQEEPTPAIDAAFSALEKANIAVAAVEIEDADNFQPWEDQKLAYAALSKVLVKFKPKTTTSAPFKQFENYLAEMSQAAQKQVGEVQEAIDGEKELRRMTKIVYEQTVTSANAVVAQIKLALPALNTAATSKPPEKVAETVVAYFTAGEGGKLAAAIQEQTKASSAIVEGAGLVEQALKLNQKRAEKGQKLQQANKTAEAQTAIEEAVRLLTAELTSGQTALEKISESAALKAAAITV
jgi:hypothetical protein